MSGWGRVPVAGREEFPDALEHTGPAPLWRGLGRSYGDSSLPPSSQPWVLSTVRANRILSFDEGTGLLRAEAGLSLHDCLRVFFPKGWFFPVTPGTQFVTLGGMVAADVHGKNHHVDGCFGQHCTRLKMRLADGRVLECGPDLEPDLFWATVGGMGLTGFILEVEFHLRRIPSPWIWMESERVPDIDTYVAKLREAAHDWPMTMGWIDCVSQGGALGRGILMKGRWATPEEAPDTFPHELPNLRFPFEAPGFLLGPLTVKAFNFLYFWKHLPKQMSKIVNPFTFFYPLDFVRDWNLMYGPRGFTQYQCVLPESAGPDVARRFLNVLTSMGGASFLCVIKDCGAQGKGLLSFPFPGMSVALDIPVRDDTQTIIDALNDFVVTVGGRIYLAKDTYTRADHFLAMDGERLAKFQEARKKWDPKGLLKSAQSVRLFGDSP